MKPFTIIGIASGILIFLAFTESCDAYDHPGGMQNYTQIESVRTHLAAGDEPWASQYAALTTFADPLLSTSPQAVAVFDVPGFYTDPVNHAILKAPLEEDARLAYACAVIYATTETVGRDVYADKVVETLNDWASTNVSVLDGGRLVMGTSTPALIMAAEMIDDYPGWTSVDRNQFENWLGTTVRTSSNESLQLGIHVTSPIFDNRTFWGMLLAVSLDRYLDDTASMEDHIYYFRHMMAVAIANDGSLPEEMTRGSGSILYTAYALEAMTATAEIIRNSGGPDLYKEFTVKGGSIRKALNYLYNNGIEDPSLWPDQTAVGDPQNDLRSMEIYAAMGPAQGVNKWTTYAAGHTAPDFSSGLGWIMPKFFVINPIP